MCPVAKQGSSNALCIAGILRLAAADNKLDFQNGVVIRTDDTDAGRGHDFTGAGGNEVVAVSETEASGVPETAGVLGRALLGAR